jgi:hypothetical protein
MRAAIAFVMVLGCACVSRAPFRPASAPSRASNEQLYRAAVRTLADGGVGVATNDPAAGIVIGEWEESSAFGTKKRYRWRITVGEGLVRVNSDCQWLNEDQFLGASEWKACEPPGNNEAERTDQARRMADEIVALAPSLRAVPEPAAPTPPVQAEPPPATPVAEQPPAP